MIQFGFVRKCGLVWRGHVVLVGGRPVMTKDFPTQRSAFVWTYETVEWFRGQG